MAFTDINSEDRLVQKTFAEHLHDKLGWDSVYAYNDEPSRRITLWGVPVSFKDSRGQQCFRQNKRNEFSSFAFWNPEEDAAAA